jgi:hypothetical protein
MPRCPLCGSAQVTVVESLYPRAVCSGCGARWIQDGHQQSAITKGPTKPHSWPRPHSPGPASWPQPATTTAPHVTSPPPRPASC